MTSPSTHATFNRWLIFAGLLFFGAYLAQQQQLPTMIVSTDRSGLSLVILTFFTAASLHVGLLAYRLGRETAATLALTGKALRSESLIGFDTQQRIVAIMFINPQARKGRVDLKAEYIISVTWPDRLADDIDLWVQDPLGETVSYLRKDAGWLHLDRDDRGEINDTIVIDGNEVVYPINQEVVTIRGIIPGEYVVNLYYYKAVQPSPFETLVKVEKINPTLKTVFVKKIEMTEQDQETTVVRFHLDDQGGLSGVNQLDKVLTPYSLDMMFDDAVL